mgnify:CR=1 FL=1
MAENFRIDSHKLIYHPCEVAKWLSGEKVYPIEMEIGLSGACNHRCIFCALDYVGYKPNFLDKDLILKNLRALSERGLKSIIFAGEGEPLMHKDAPEIFNATKSYGVDVALSTNGALLTKEISEKCLQSMTWIRFSIAAATDETYDKIQRGRKGDLQRVYKNLQDAVQIKRDKNLSVTLGGQLLLLEDNKDEVYLLAKNLREIGLDYITIKPFIPSKYSSHLIAVDYSDSIEIERRVKELVTEDFDVYYRHQAVKNLSMEKPYEKCYALPFMTHISAAGEIFPCVAYVGIKEFLYGNLYEKSFVEIWESDRTREIMEKFSGEFLKKNCRKACRLDEMNKYLSELKNPGAHVNFI